MKQFKKLCMVLLCACAIMSVTACGSKNAADDNGAVSDGANTDTTGNKDNTNNTTDNGNVNDVTDGTDNDRREGVLDEIGDDVRDGMDNVGDAVDGKDTRQ